MKRPSPLPISLSRLWAKGSEREDLQVHPRTRGREQSVDQVGAAAVTAVAAETAAAANRRAGTPGDGDAEQRAGVGEESDRDGSVVSVVDGRTRIEDNDRVSEPAPPALYPSLPRAAGDVSGPQRDPVGGAVTKSVTPAGHSASPAPDANETPLAREIAELTRRRAALASDQLPLPVSTRIFTIANQKGGVGKTTTTVNLAAALARAGARVLVIDLDPQGNASTALGVDHRADTPSIYDVIIDDEPMADVVQQSPECATLFCVPATIHLAGAEIELVSLVAREQRLHSALRAFLSQVPEPFHYVFIDCPPSLGLLTINAFVAASEVLIPIQCEYYALEGLSQLLNNIALIEKHLNPQLRVSTILLTMFDSRTNLANQVAQEVRQHFPDKVLATAIPRSVRISEAPSYGQTVISYDTNSAGALSYREAAAEMARRGVPQ